MDLNIIDKEIVTESGLIICPVHSEHVTALTYICLTIEHEGLTAHISSGNMQGPAQGEEKADGGNYQFGELIWCDRKMKGSPNMVYGKSYPKHFSKLETFRMVLWILHP